MSLSRKLFAELTGTAVLLCAVIGSGIMAERLSGGNAAIALLANTLATVFALYVLIETLGPISGAHFNPLVSAVMAWRGELCKNHVLTTLLAYATAQLAGAALGAMLANAMFDLSLINWSTKLRNGPALWLAEGVATAGLLFTILRAPAGKASGLVACYIGAAYWFTASTSFANPAAVFGRMMSDSFAGIAPQSAFAFVIAQCVGCVIGVLWANSLQVKSGR